jgi:hypothetical protein
MKRMIAKYANALLVIVSIALLTTNSYLSHRPELPTELLKK